MMILKFSILCLIGLWFNLSVNAQNWVWVDVPTGTNIVEVGIDVCVDGKGNVYSTGYFEGPTINFGNITLTNASSGLADIYLTKYDDSGNVLWAKSAGSIDHDSPSGIAPGHGTDIILTGVFYSATISFDSIMLANVSPGSADIFLVKYSADGNVIWAKSAGGEHDDKSHGVATDGSGNIYITGSYLSNVIDFDTITLANTTIGHFYSDFFIAKYDNQGNVVWVKSASGNLSENGTAVSTDISGNVITTGNVVSPIIDFGNNILTCPGAGDIFVVKYDSNGNIIWNEIFGDTASEFDVAICTDLNQNILITGNFKSTQVSFGNYTLMNNSNSNSSDLFLVKVDSNGTVIWAQNPGDSTDELGKAVCADQFNNIYLAAKFVSPFITIGSQSFFSPPQISPSHEDHLCVTKFDSNGVIICGTALESGGNDYNGIIADNLGSVYLVGDFQTNSILIGSDTLDLDGTFGTVYTAKFNCTGVGIRDPESGSGNRLIITPNPAHNDLVVNDYSFSGSGDIEIFNVLGCLCIKVNVQLLPVGINITSLETGIYFVKIQNERGCHFQKFVVE